MDCVGWIYQQDHKTGRYIFESGYLDADSENIITVFLRVNDGVKREDSINERRGLENDK